jgi:hypothetical protein
MAEKQVKEASETPEWLNSFLEKVAACFDVGVGDVGYHYFSDHDGEIEAWEVYMYPAPTVVEGIEGTCIPANLHLELCTVGAHFDEVQDIMWRTTGEETTISISGMVNGASVYVKFTPDPPDDAVATKKVYENGVVEDIKRSN